jgi:ABC-type multidrug transport system ATPase subunit
MLAILGPSGAGKSTLLDVLSGRPGRRRVQGRVSLQGRTVRPADLRRVCGYVLQDDVFQGAAPIKCCATQTVEELWLSQDCVKLLILAMRPSLAGAQSSSSRSRRAGTSTVEEYLHFNARLRLPRGTSAAAIAAAVAALLHAFGLERCAHSRIGDSMLRGISGGEKRRLSIASELLTKPRVLLVDEATTGLDATSAKHVVAVLGQLAAAGVTVVLSIHQPRADIFAMMSHVLLLSGRGRTVFSGAAGLAEAHFARLGREKPADVNVADFILDVVIKSPAEEVQAMVDAFEASALGQRQAQASGAAEYAAALAGEIGTGALDIFAKRSAPLSLQARPPLRTTCSFLVYFISAQPAMLLF